MLQRPRVVGNSLPPNMTSPSPSTPFRRRQITCEACSGPLNADETGSMLARTLASNRVMRPLCALWQALLLAVAAISLANSASSPVRSTLAAAASKLRLPWVVPGSR